MLWLSQWYMFFFCWRNQHYTLSFSLESKTFAATKIKLRRALCVTANGGPVHVPFLDSAVDPEYRSYYHSIEQMFGSDTSCGTVAFYIWFKDVATRKLSAIRIVRIFVFATEAFRMTVSCRSGYLHGTSKIETFIHRQLNYPYFDDAYLLFSRFDWSQLALHFINIII